MLKKIKIILCSLLLTLIGAHSFAVAQGTILPKVEDKTGCEEQIAAFNQARAENKTVDGSGVNDILGCAVVTGRVSLAMVPYFIRYISNYLLGMIGLVALLFTVLGGFLYTAGGLTEQKDKGKAYIKNALIGMGMAFLAWSIVNVIIAAITG